MLVEFSVQNFKSFAREQRISLSAGRFKSERVGAILNTSSKTAPHLLRAAAIMGANGSGKSTLIEALDFIQSFVARSAQSMQRGDEIAVTPFKLDEDSKSKPSSFELVFLSGLIEYTYQVSLNRQRVVHESLFSREGRQSLKQVFARSFEDGRESWGVGTLPKIQAKLWQQSTRANASFLSTAVQLNAESLKAPFDWITSSLRIQSAGSPFSSSLTSHMVKEHVGDGCSQAIINLMREADLGIRDIQIDEEPFRESDLPSDMPDELRKSVIKELKDKKFLDAKFEHIGKERKRTFLDYDEESDGTQRLYEMAGPLVTSLRHGYTLVVDELEDSLHPYLVRMIVSMFQKPADEESTAQLIFSTHGEGLLDANILERDQFWFVDKKTGESELTPLNDYKPRKGEALRVNFLRGRYGGVPAIAHVER